MRERGAIIRTHILSGLRFSVVDAGSEERNVRLFPTVCSIQSLNRASGEEAEAMPPIVNRLTGYQLVDGPSWLGLLVIGIGSGRHM